MLQDAAYTVAGNIVIGVLAAIAAVLYGRWFWAQWSHRSTFSAIWVIGGVASLTGMLSIQSFYYGAARLLVFVEINLWDQLAATATMRLLFIAALIGVIGAYLLIFCRNRRQAALWTALITAVTCIALVLISAVLQWPW